MLWDRGANDRLPNYPKGKWELDNWPENQGYIITFSKLHCHTSFYVIHHFTSYIILRTRPPTIRQATHNSPLVTPEVGVPEGGVELPDPPPTQHFFGVRRMLHTQSLVFYTFLSSLLFLQAVFGRKLPDFRELDQKLEFYLVINFIICTNSLSMLQEIR